MLQAQPVEILVIAGGETDVCLLATTLGTIDLSYRVILVEDAVCKSDDQTSGASLKFLRNRFSVQLEVTATDDFLQQARG